MATIPPTNNWAQGEKVVLAKLQQEVRDGMSFLLNPPQAKASLTALFTIATSSTNWSLIRLGTEDWDTDAMHGAATTIGDAQSDSRITCVTPGIYEVSLGTVYASNITGSRGVMVRLNAGGKPPSMAAAPYTWAAGIVQVTLAAHGYTTGQRIYLNPSTGGLTPQTLVITAVAAGTFDCALAGSGVAGNLTFGLDLFDQKKVATAPAGHPTSLSKQFQQRLVAGDYLETFAFQDSASVLDVNPGSEETYLALRFEAI